MKRTLLFTAVVFATLLLHGTSVHAQLTVPIPALDPQAIAKATEEVRKTYPDAVLKATASVGVEIPPPLGQPGERAGLNITNGKSEYWGYSFYSPAQQQTAVVAVALVGIPGFATYQAIVPPADSTMQFEFPVGPNPLDQSGAYANSPAMVAKLATDTTFMRFRARFPNREKADFAAFSDAGDTSVPTPGFPIDAPVWVVGFSGGGDSSMFCAIASKTGQTFCERLEIPTLGVEDDQSLSARALRVYPNPAVGMTRVEINAPAGTRFGAGAGASLFNAQGEKVLDLTGNMAGDAFRAVEFDAASLASGTYFCVVQSGSWIVATRIVVGK